MLDFANCFVDAFLGSLLRAMVSLVKQFAAWSKSVGRTKRSLMPANISWRKHGSHH